MDIFLLIVGVIMFVIGIFTKIRYHAKINQYNGALIIAEDEDGTYTFLEFEEASHPNKLQAGDEILLQIRKKNKSYNGKN